MGDSPSLFTPPYSPTSSSSSPQQPEELSHDLLMDVHECADRLLSSPEGSPSYYSYPEAGLCHQSPSDSVPAVAEPTFDQAAFGVLSTHSPLPSSSPTYDFPPCTSDARLVPDCLSASDTCESSADCALHPDDFSLLEQPQGGSLVQLHHVVPHELPMHSSLLTPSQSPISTEPNLYNEREQAEISILAQQISSLASSFDMHHTLNPLQNAIEPAGTNILHSACDWPHNPPPPPPPLASDLLPKRELILDDGVFDSILKDLNMVPRKSNTSSPGVIFYSYQQGLEQFTTDSMAPFSLQSGHHGQNTGLHQLNHYMQSSLQQGNLHQLNRSDFTLNVHVIKDYFH